MTPDETTRIFKMLGDIKGLLLGTYEKPEGVVSKVEKHDKWIEKQKKSREGLANYTYKFIIMLALTYIAISIGVK